MSTTSVGREAEDAVTKHLQKQGHKIVEQNWKNRWCEIDIVSTKNDCVFFTEVKYRGSSDWGGGLEYIGPKKLKQMQFAAEFWLSQNNWQGEAQLLAAEVNISLNISVTEI